MKIILASNSPRRKQLLEQIDIDFEVVISEIDESVVVLEKIEQYVEQLAYLKAKDVYDKLKYDRVVIGADTVVAFNGKILGKPIDEQDAFDMLKTLQGNMCEVLTGLCVLNSKSDIEYITHDKCRVYIQKMTDNEIWEYIKTGEPMDKAGAFAIQGIGAKYITKISGDYYSVVGLPVNKLYNILKKEVDYIGECK